MNRSMVMAIWFLVAEFNGTKVVSQVEQLGWWPNKGKGVRSKVSPTTMCFLQQSAASAPSKSTGSDLNSAVPRAGEEEGEGREKEGGRWLRCTSVPVAGCRGCELEDGASSSKVKEEGFAQREDNARLCRHTDGSSERKRPPGWLRLDFGSLSSIRKRSSRDRRGGSSSGGSSDGSSGRRRSTATSAVVLLRGGEASIASTSLPSETKGSGKGDKDGKGDSKGGGGKEDGSWGINLNVFGWGADSEAEAEAKAEKKRKAQQDMEESEAREAMRKAREERLERELEESGAREEVEKELLEGGPEDKTAGGILVAMAKVADPVGKMFSANDNNRLWLDAVEGFVAAISIVLVSLYPVWHTLRGMFGLSLLFYGDHFSTLAFHIVVFRISGWKKAAKSKNDLVAYYKKARQTMSKAARDVRASAAIIARKNRLVARKEEMMAEKKRLHAMGRVSAEEARAFIDKYRQDIEHIAREQEVLAEASSSILAIKGALSFKKLASSINSLYAAVITSITASTFKRAGQLTLALTCGGLIKRTLFDLLGPIIDPIGYQIELETYVANIMRGPANLYITLVGYLGSASVFFHFFVDPQQALTITFVLLGARVVTDYIVAALNPVRWRFGMSKKLDNMPVSAVIYLSLATLGFAFHGNAGLVGDYLCKPFIAFLGLLNKGLNHFQATTITYFS